MSRIENIQTANPRNMNLKTSKMDKNSTFAGAAPSRLYGDGENIVLDAVRLKIRKRLGAWGWIAKGLSMNKGEVQTNLINAAFTATLAPLFIAYNPFSHQDKNTKKYAASRQPISAAIALGCVLPITIAIDKVMNSVASNGFIKFLDLRMNPDRDYLKGKFNKEYAKTPNKLEFLAKYADSEFEGNVTSRNGTTPTRAYKRSCAEKYVKTIQGERQKTFARLISEEPGNIKINEVTKTISVIKKDAKTGNNIIEEIGKNIPNMTTQKELDEYLSTNSLHNKTFAQFLKEEFKYEFYKDGKLKPSNTKSRQSSILATDFFRKIGLIGENTALKGHSIDETELLRTLALVRQKGKVEPVVAREVASTVFPHGGAERVINAFGSQMTRISQLHVGQAVSEQETMTVGQLFHPLDLRKDKLQNLMDNSLANALEEFAKPLRKLATEGFNPNASLKDFATNIIKNNADKMGNYFGNYKSFAGIFFNLFTTAIACSLLNWAYPRIIERVRPEWAKDDKAPAPKGGNK